MDKSLKFLVMGDSWYIPLAQALAENGKNKVFLHTEWEKAEPALLDYAPGYEMDYLTKVKRYSSLLKNIDCIACFGINFNDAVIEFKDRFPNRSAYGSALGEDLENNRWALKKLIHSLGLPLQKSWKVTGIDTLRNFLKEHKDVYVKTDIFRKDLDSFPAKDYDSVEGKLDKLAADVGVPFKNDIVFTVEEKLDSKIESGVDLFCNGIDYLKPYLYGYEENKTAAIEMFSNTLPVSLNETMVKFLPVLRKLDYRGMLATEEIVFSDKKHYLLDFCGRGASPMSLAFPSVINNFTEVIYKIGLKQPVQMQVNCKYVAVSLVGSPEGEKVYLKLNLKKGYENNVKLYCPCKRGNDYYSVKGSYWVAALVGWGNSIKEAMSMCEKSADYIDCDGIDKDFTDLRKIPEKIEQGKKVGISFG